MTQRSAQAGNRQAEKIHLWDLPLRLFHWLLVVAVTAAIITAKIGGEWMVWHGRAGLAIVGLLAFRLTWGIVGSTTARFAHFAPRPSSLRAYLKGQWQGVGHNPLGALAVFLLLGLLIAQVLTGLFANDDIDFNGPWFSLVDKDLSDRLTGLHHSLSNMLLALLGLHVAAILFYLIAKKNNLILPMLTGTKKLATNPGEKHEPAGWRALIVSIAVALLAIYASAKTDWTAPSLSARIDTPTLPQKITR
ncbi:MAG TPA: cytochrome b/b6 domain-containing protein [Burkholderiaceae bacterium]